MNHIIEAPYNAAQNIAAPAMIVGPDMRIAYANERATEWLAGHDGTAAEPVGLPVKAAMPWLPETASLQLRIVLATGTARIREYQCQLARSWALVQIEASVISTPQLPRAVLLTFRDLTGAGGRRATTHIKDEALERSPGATALFGLDGYLTYANPAFLELWRIEDREAVLGSHFAVLWNGQTAFDDVARAVRRSGNWSGELVASRGDGSIFPVHLTVSLVQDDAAAATALVAVATDIGDRVGLEDSLAESEATLRAVLDARPDTTLLLDPNGTVLMVNSGAAALLEQRPEVLIGRELHTALPRESADLLRQHLAAACRSGRPVAWEDTMSGRALCHTLSPVADGHGGVGRLILASLDVTDHNGATDALRDSHRVLAAVIEASPIAIAALDANARVVVWNQSAERVFGWSEEQATGQRLPDLCCSDIESEPTCVAAVLAGKHITGLEATCRRPDGLMVDVVVSASPLRDAGNAITGAVVAVADVTERNRLRTCLRESQRTDAAIDLAGGVAHGLTNLLQTLTSYAEVLNVRSTDPTQVLAVANNLAQQVRRGAALAENLTLFSRRSATFRQPADLNQLLLEASPMLQTLLPENINVRVEPGAGLLPVEADTRQFAQVLIGLAQNAADAMPDGGRLVLATGSEGEHVWFEARDNGFGIAPEALLHACEPFFTTKDPFRHPGLGLSLAHDIIAEHGGTLQLASTPGEGTVAHVELPRAVGVPAATSIVAHGFEDLPSANGERVLIVEDEDGARQGLWDMMTVLGYRAVAVSSGAEAGMLPAEWRFDALLTDVILPDIPGPELVTGLRDRWPELRVILMSACPEDDVRRRPSVEAEAHFLQKPFDLGTLARELRVVLDTPPQVTIAA
jgi:two-component system, cell cycle sensor histidine kinase and response regulator CckA